VKPGAAANWIVTKSSQSLKLQKRLLHDLLSITNFVPRETAGCCSAAAAIYILLPFFSKGFGGILFSREKKKKMLQRDSST
jgi:hypothetical protein